MDDQEVEELPRTSPVSWQTLLADLPTPTLDPTNGVGLLPSPNATTGDLDALLRDAGIPTSPQFQQPALEASSSALGSVPPGNSMNTSLQSGSFGRFNSSGPESMSIAPYQASPTGTSFTNGFPPLPDIKPDPDNMSSIQQNEGQQLLTNWRSGLATNTSSNALGIHSGGLGQIQRPLERTPLDPTKWANGSLGFTLPDPNAGEAKMIVPFGSGATQPNTLATQPNALTSTAMEDIKPMSAIGYNEFEDETGSDTDFKALEFSTWDDKQAQNSLQHLPDRFEDLTDYQLAFIDRVKLRQLMEKAGLTPKEMQEVKVRRRKLKNRQSAKNAVGKKKRQFQGLAAANSQLSNTVDKLKRQNAVLQGRNKQLEQSFAKAAQLARQAARERELYEAEIRRLTAMVQGMNTEPRITEDEEPKITQISN
eukprot:m.29440 g.29440  ORF g.29440 m.29440 type:complete len:423 (-) comp8102_c0_seq1:1023-2291(-)